jgi:hypothetical protein
MLLVGIVGVPQLLKPCSALTTHLLECWIKCHVNICPACMCMILVVRQSARFTQVSATQCVVFQQSWWAPLFPCEGVALFPLAERPVHVQSPSHVCLPCCVYLCFLQSWPVSRLTSEGVALLGLAAAPAGGMYRDVLLKFFLPNRPLPFHSFSQVIGRKCCCCTGVELWHRHGYVGVECPVAHGYMACHLVLCVVLHARRMLCCLHVACFAARTSVASCGIQGSQHWGMRRGCNLLAEGACDVHHNSRTTSHLLCFCRVTFF